MPQGTDVGAVRVFASGWEGWVLEGLQVSSGETAFQLAEPTALSSLAERQSQETHQHSAVYMQPAAYFCMAQRLIGLVRLCKI